MRVLFLTHRLPYAPNRGDRVRAYHLLARLSAEADVDVFSLVHDDDEASNASSIAGVSSVTTARVRRARGLVRSVAALGTTTPITHTMLDSPEVRPALHSLVEARRPDVVLAYCSGMARLVFDEPLNTIPFVLDMVDVDSAKWDALGRITAPPMRWIYRREHRVLRAFEARATAAAFATTVVTEQEASTLRQIAAAGHVHVVPNGVDVAGLTPTRAPSAAPSVVFCGVMNYAPNVEAARLLALDVWPKVRQRHPDATLTLVGSHPTRQVLALVNHAHGVEVTGAVPDVRPYLWNAAIAAAPLLTARGIQNKVLEAVAAGLPTVVTPNIMGTLPPAVARGCVAGDGVDELADAINTLLSMTPHERRSLAERADLGPLAWDQQLAPLGTLLEEAARSTRRAA